MTTKIKLMWTIPELKIFVHIFERVLLSYPLDFLRTDPSAFQSITLIAELYGVLIIKQQKARFVEQGSKIKVVLTQATALSVIVLDCNYQAFGFVAEGTYEHQVFQELYSIIHQKYLV